MIDSSITSTNNTNNHDNSDNDKNIPTPTIILPSFPYALSTKFSRINHEVDYFVNACKLGKTDEILTIIEYWKHVEQWKRVNSCDINDTDTDQNRLFTLEENFNALDSFGFSGLMRAASLVSRPAKSCEIIQILLENGAKVNFANKQGVTALNRAIFYKNKQAIRMLILEGGDVSSFDIHGRAAIDYAYADIELLKMIDSLLEPVTKAVHNLFDRDSASIVMGYIRRDFTDILKDGQMSRFTE